MIRFSIRSCANFAGYGGEQGKTECIDRAKKEGNPLSTRLWIGDGSDRSKLPCRYKRLLRSLEPIDSPPIALN